MKKTNKMVLALFLLSLIFSVSAQAEEMPSGVMQKLDQIERNQQSILAKLDELKSEIQIVKVRSTING